MGSELWHPDIKVTKALAKRSIEDRFSTLSPIKSIKCIGEGWDNKVFLVNEDIIFRFPHRKIAVELIERENVTLGHLHSKINIEIPNPKYIGHPSAYYPYPFHGYRMIKGVSGCHANLTPHERIASLTPLATFLKQLHSITEKRAIAMSGKNQVFDRTRTYEVANALNERVDKIIARKICKINKNCFQHEIMEAKKIELSFDAKVLVHGDLYCCHLMFNQGRLTGVIDWGDIGINNPSVDLAVIFSFYPSSCHKQFFEIYGEIEENTWQYARFLGLYSVLTNILYGYDIGDTMLLKEAINAVKRINPELLGVTN